MRDYTVGDYLLQRLDELGIEHLFGVPGDYNLSFLDRVIAHPRLRWVGCANELNAAYAADGYARCRGAAALLTTFGVGELSAINGIAGSYAEHLPVIHIVGAPAERAQQGGELLHHTLGDGDFRHFVRMSDPVTAARAVLTADNACGEIDRVLLTAWRARRPGYLLLSTTAAAVPAAPPRQPLCQHTPAATVPLAFREAVAERLARAGRVSLLADFLADRFGLSAALNQWVAEVPMAHATLLMGKGLFNEQRRGFVGTYAGQACAAVTREAIETADLIITAGVKYTDTITAGFTQQLAPARTLALMPDGVNVGDRAFPGIGMAEALTVLRGLSRDYAAGWLPCTATAPTPPPPPPADSGLTQQAFWYAIQHFLRPDDIVVVEQGTSAFGAFALRLPPGVTLIGQPLWGSIGFSLPAAFGAATAAPGRRVILIIGDGSAQLTIQELGSMLRDGLTPIIFLLNNDGYTVERAIHGPNQRYNDIAAWNWTRLPQALSRDAPARSLRVSDPAALTAAMTEMDQPQALSLVEVMLPREDTPPLLQAVSRALQQRNSANQEC
ncbi:alpha-keto acid decarboxylase family protein [Pantoea sp. 1.19]|uniref:alpha-keto acid decarboxylase family protein n=1 Tax=Pantoea sp. 1.19 TaxID=1925589 RepID=UPI000948A0B1|nr:thiamine pyrophosphate-binding protein [Pantoea sp. 1.19]